MIFKFLLCSAQDKSFYLIPSEKGLLKCDIFCNFFLLKTDEVKMSRHNSLLLTPDQNNLKAG